jgi:hypothetical protein
MGQGLSLSSARLRPAALLVGAVALIVAGCAPTTGQVGFWDFFWSMIVFFFWFMFIWIFISIFADIFRRNDLSGAWKAIWIIALVFLPFLGALIYMITRPKATAQDVQMMARAEAAQRAVAGVSTADELTKLQQLKDSGTITEAEFQSLKAGIVGTPAAAAAPAPSTPPSSPSAPTG